MGELLTMLQLLVVDVESVVRRLGGLKDGANGFRPKCLCLVALKCEFL